MSSVCFRCLNVSSDATYGRLCLLVYPQVTSWSFISVLRTDYDSHCRDSFGAAGSHYHADGEGHVRCCTSCHPLRHRRRWVLPQFHLSRLFQPSPNNQKQSFQAEKGASKSRAILHKLVLLGNSFGGFILPL